GDEIIKFVITSVTTVSNSSSPFNGYRELTVTVTDPNCAAAYLYGESVIVHDTDDQCLTADESDEDLEGRYGWAFKGVSTDKSSGATEGDLTPCHFVLMGLCCPPEA